MKRAVQDVDTTHAVMMWGAFAEEADMVAFGEQKDAEGGFPTGRGHFTLKSLMAHWAWLWAEDGFVQLACASHTYAAALMATDTTCTKGDLKLQARALRVAVPDGLLRAEINDDSYHYRWAYVFTSDRGHAVAFSENPWFAYWDKPSAQRITATLGGYNYTWDEMLFEDGFREKDEQQIANMETKRRIQALGKRYVVGLLYTLQYTNNFREHYRPHRRGMGQPLRAEPPPHRNVIIGAPIKVDARPQIRMWLESGKVGRKRTAPSVQHIVRGHYKRQVIGVGRKGRKVIWVQPYWRGPEGAPILARPYEVGADA